MPVSSRPCPRDGGPARSEHASACRRRRRLPPFSSSARRVPFTSPLNAAAVWLLCRPRPCARGPHEVTYVG